MQPRYLFTRRGQAALAALMRRHPLLAFDFDGTLAPIVQRPHEARVPAAVSARLAWLSRRVPVAIVTGRAAGDVRARLGFVPQYVVGNHGAEDEGQACTDGAALMRAVDPLRRLLFQHAGELATAGVQVEDKGLSIALHYRQSPRPEQALGLIGALTSNLPPTVQVFGGKMVVNAVAAQAPDKAEAVRRLQSHCSAGGVFYIGDDVNDEPVFAVATAQWVTVRVGREAASSRARFFLEDVHEVAPMLDRLLAHLPRPRA